MTIRWEGVDEFEKWLKVTPGIVAKDVAGGLNEEGEEIMAVSKRDTPVDTGRLRSTGHVKPPTVRQSTVQTVLAYGTDYAIFVHEIPATHPSGRSKFLEANVNAAARGFGGRLMRRIQRRLR